MGYTDTARVLAESHGIEDYPVVDEEQGEKIYDEVIRDPGDYARNATLVLVYLDLDEVTHMSRPELERALFTGSVISFEAVPTPNSRHGHLLKIQEGDPRHSDTGYFGLPGNERPGIELGRVFEAVTDPRRPEDTAASVWGVSHHTATQFALDYRDALDRLRLYPSGDEPDADRVNEALTELYA